MTIWSDGLARTEGNDRHSIGKPTDAQVYSNKTNISRREDESEITIKLIGHFNGTIQGWCQGNLKMQYYCFTV